MTDSRADEETPLLLSAEDPIVTVITHEESNEVVTPLPKLQIGILLLALLAEPICSQCIYPFINQVTRRILTVHRRTPNALLAHRRVGYHRWRREESGILRR